MKQIVKRIVMIMILLFVVVSLGCMSSPSPTPSTSPTPSPPASTPTPPPKPIADFTWEGKYAGEGIEFISKSENATSWLWDFGDGSAKSNEQHPHHTYQLPGVYSVNLIVKNSGGLDTNAKVLYIFKKGESYLLELKVEPDPTKLEAGVSYKAIVPFLADEGVEILNAYLFWNWEGPFVFNLKGLGLKAPYPPPPTFFWLRLHTNNPGAYNLRCYVDYHLPDGSVQKSNEVSRDINVR